MLEPDFSSFPELHTKRLLLRRIAITDAAMILEMRSSEKVMEFIDKERATSIEDGERFCNVIDTAVTNNEGITWGISLSEDPSHSLIGTIGLWRIIKPHYRAEIGYMLHHPYWRKGIMEEALEAVTRYGFETLKLHSIEAHINPGNAGSARLLEKQGFIREAYFREDFFFRGEFRDTAIYSLLQKDL